MTATATATELHAIFADVCEIAKARGKERLRMDKPFGDDGYIYATDGSIAVRVKSDDAKSMAVEGAPKKAAGIFVWFLPKRVALPSVDCDAQRPCETCKATGKVEKYTCDTCDGNGKVSCSCECGEESHDVDCPECDGACKPPGGECRDCEGLGKMFNKGDAVQVAGKFALDPAYIALLQQHGVTHVNIARRNNGYVCSFAVGGDIEGMLMKKDVRP